MDLASITDASRIMPRYLNEITEEMSAFACKNEPMQSINKVKVLYKFRYCFFGV